MKLTFEECIEKLKNKGRKNGCDVERVRRMLEKREKMGGVVKGFHGTSLGRAVEIQKCGFRNCLCNEGGFGVYFWDEEFKDNAFKFATEKALADKHGTIAIFEAKIYNPEPDWLEARPQWIVDCGNIEIINTYFCNVESLVRIRG